VLNSIPLNHFQTVLFLVPAVKTNIYLCPTCSGYSAVLSDINL